MATPESAATIPAIVGTVWLEFGIRDFAAVNVFVAIGWFLLAYLLGKAYQKRNC